MSGLSGAWKFGPPREMSSSPLSSANSSRASSMHPLGKIDEKKEKEREKEKGKGLAAATEKLRLAGGSRTVLKDELQDFSEAHYISPAEGDTVQTRYSFMPGRIFSTFVHTSDTSYGSLSNKKNSSFTTTHTKVHHGYREILVLTKYCKFVVVATFQDMFVALPIFTFNQGGPVDRQKATDEFVSIRDANRLPHAPPKSQHPSLLCTLRPQFREGGGWFNMTNTTIVALTQPISFRYGTEATLVGDVVSDHTTRLVTLFHDTFLEDVKKYLTSNRGMLDEAGKTILGSEVDEEGFEMPKSRTSSVKGGGDSSKYRPRNASVESGKGGYNSGSGRGGNKAGSWRAGYGEPRPLVIGSKVTEWWQKCYKCGKNGHYSRSCPSVGK